LNNNKYLIKYIRTFINYSLLALGFSSQGSLKVGGGDSWMSPINKQFSNMGLMVRQRLIDALFCSLPTNFKSKMFRRFSRLCISDVMLMRRRRMMMMMMFVAFSA